MKNSDTSQSEDIKFIYGDDYGDIEIEKLGSMNGTTHREMLIPRRLAFQLNDTLSDELYEHQDKYLVVVDANTGFAELANVCVVEASSEKEARNKVNKMDNHQNFGKFHIRKLDELDDNWSFFR